MISVFTENYNFLPEINYAQKYGKVVSKIILQVCVDRLQIMGFQYLFES